MKLLECLTLQSQLLKTGIIIAFAVALLALCLHAWLSYRLWPYEFGKGHKDKGNLARLLSPCFLSVIPSIFLPLSFYLKTKELDLSLCEKIWGWFMSLWYFGAGLFLSTLLIYFMGGAILYLIFRK